MKRTLALLATLTIASLALVGTASADDRYISPDTPDSTCTPVAEPPYKSGTLIRGYGGFDCDSLASNQQGWLQIQRWTGSTYVNEGSPITGGYDTDWWRQTDTTGCTSANPDATRRLWSKVTYTSSLGTRYTKHTYSTGRYITC